MDCIKQNQLRCWYRSKENNEKDCLIIIERCTRYFDNQREDLQTEIAWKYLCKDKIDWHFERFLLENSYLLSDAD